MTRRRNGLVQTWDGKRTFCYSFRPRDNDSLKVFEVLPKDLIPFDELPMEVQAELNISMGQAGWRRTRWEKFTSFLWRIRTAPQRAWLRWRS